MSPGVSSEGKGSGFPKRHGGAAASAGAGSSKSDEIDEQKNKGHRGLNKKLKKRRRHEKDVKKSKALSRKKYSENREEYRARYFAQAKDKTGGASVDEVDSKGIAFMRLARAVRAFLRAYQDDIADVSGIFASLDQNEKVDIEGIENEVIKSALRDIFETLGLLEKEDGFRKPAAMSFSLENYMKSYISDAMLRIANSTAENNDDPDRIQEESDDDECDLFNEINDEADQELTEEAKLRKQRKNEARRKKRALAAALKKKLMQENSESDDEDSDEDDSDGESMSEEDENSSDEDEKKQEKKKDSKVTSVKATTIPAQNNQAVQSAKPQVSQNVFSLISQEQKKNFLEQSYSTSVKSTKENTAIVSKNAGNTTKLDFDAFLNASFSKIPAKKKVIPSSKTGTATSSAVSAVAKTENEIGTDQKSGSEIIVEQKSAVQQPAALIITKGSSKKLNQQINLVI